MRVEEPASTAAITTVSGENDVPTLVTTASPTAPANCDLDDDSLDFLCPAASIPYPLRCTVYDLDSLHLLLMTLNASMCYNKPKSLVELHHASSTTSMAASARASARVRARSRDSLHQTPRRRHGFLRGTRAQSDAPLQELHQAIQELELRALRNVSKWTLLVYADSNGDAVAIAITQRRSPTVRIDRRLARSKGV